METVEVMNGHAEMGGNYCNRPGKRALCFGPDASGNKARSQMESISMVDLTDVLTVRNRV